MISIGGGGGVVAGLLAVVVVVIVGVAVECLASVAVGSSMTSFMISLFGAAQQDVKILALGIKLC